MSEVLRTLKKSRFWIYAGSVVMLDFAWLYIVNGNIFIYKRSFINLFLLPKVYTVNMVGFLLPIVPLLFIFSKSVKEDYNGVKYCMVMALSAPVMLAFAYLAELLLYWVIDPSVKTLAFPPSGLFSSVLETNPIGYIFLYIVHICVWGYVLTLFGLAVYQRTKNEFYAVVMAFLLSRFSSYIPVVFCNIKVSVLSYIVPQLPYEKSQMEDNCYTGMMQVLVVFIVSIILMMVKRSN